MFIDYIKLTWKYWLLKICLFAMIWVSGLIPRRIAQASSNIYVREHFYEMHMSCIDAQYSKEHKGYIVNLTTIDGKTFYCLMGPALFPTSFKQGLPEIEDYYWEHRYEYIVKYHSF